MEELIWATYRNIKLLLEQAERNCEDPAITARPCLQIVVRELGLLKKKIDPAAITDPAQQIRFYKDIFPAYMSEIIYYMTLIKIDSDAAALDHAALGEYYASHLMHICRYLEKQSFLRSYCQQHKTHLDPLLFKSPNTEVQIYPDTEEYKDATFFNFNSFKASKIRAYERLQQYLLRYRGEGHRELRTQPSGQLPAAFATLDQNEVYRQELLNLTRKIQWMESKADTATISRLSLPIQRLRQLKKRQRQFWERHGGPDGAQASQ